MAGEEGRPIESTLPAASEKLPPAAVVSKMPPGLTMIALPGRFGEAVTANVPPLATVTRLAALRERGGADLEHSPVDRRTAGVGGCSTEDLRACSDLIQ